MKKLNLIKLIIVIFVLFSSITVTAEILPAKNVWCLDDKSILVLHENGDLYIGDSIETQNPEMLATNVLDIKYRGKIIAILYKNGDIGIGKLSNASNEPFEMYATIKANAKNIYNIGFNSGMFSFVFIDNNDSLYGILPADNNNYKLVFLAKNVTKCCAITNDRFLVLDNSTLYHLSPVYEGYGPLYKDGKPVFEKEKVLDNVKDVILNVVLKTNGDMYYFDDYYNYLDGTSTPQRIGTNISSLDTLILNEHKSKIKLPIYSINEKKQCLEHTKEEITAISENVKKAYLKGYDIYLLKNDNTLYLKATNQSEKLLALNVEKMFTNNYNFFVGTDKNLYILNEKDKWELYMSDVKEVIKSSNGYEYLFIRENGELWGAKRELGEDMANAPFLTAFCQKRINLIINGKETPLNAKIQTVNDRTMYPFRECLENMGATVIWDDINKTAIGEYNEITIEFPIGTNKYYINGVQHEMDTVSYIDNAIGRTYIPLRYAAEGLGFTVDWTEGTIANTITISN